MNFYFHNGFLQTIANKHVAVRWCVPAHNIQRHKFCKIANSKPVYSIVKWICYTSVCTETSAIQFCKFYSHLNVLRILFCKVSSTFVSKIRETTRKT